jgi:hypothetical protein
MVILGLCAAAWPWKPISWSSRRTVLVLTVLVLMFLPEAVWNSVVSVATGNRRFLRAMCFSTRRSRLHFTITALTVDRQLWQGRKFTNWLVGKVASYDGATLKVTELFSKAILLSVFVYGDCMATFLSATFVAEIGKSTNLKGCPHTFVYIV